jgi:hypothetical protein
MGRRLYRRDAFANLQHFCHTGLLACRLRYSSTDIRLFAIHQITPIRKTLVSAALGAALFAGSQLAAAAAAVVTNGNDAGEGSLRAALESGAREIVIATDQDIMITTPLVYDGDKSLSIIGSGQTVMTQEDITLLTMSNGASLTVIGMNFQGPGGFDIENQSTASSPGKGIFIDVRDDQTGTVKLVMKNVTVSDVANHGVHISDCDLADDCGGGGGGAGGGSTAQIVVEADNVTIDNVGQGKFDADGIRVDERNNGNILFSATNSTFTRVGADGVELDEGQNGIVRATVIGSSFDANGDYCNPELLEPQLDAFLDGAPDEAEFDEGEQVTEDDIPGPPEGFLDNGCIEYALDLYDSGFVEAYEYAIDVDDGFDIDEAGNGSLKAMVVDTTITDNFDEGIDFDEEDNGSIEVVFVGTSASGNTDDGYKMSESGNASVTGVVTMAVSTQNGGKGFVFEEEDNGNVDVQVFATQTSDNDDSDDTGIEAVQEDVGSGTLTVTDSTIADGFDLEGVELIEN